MSSLAPGRDHLELAFVTSSVVLSEPPLFRDEPMHEKTLALVVAIQYRASGFRSDALGDHGRSYCSMQIHESIGGSDALLRDPSACVRAGLSFLRASLRVDPSHPVAFYARGPRYESLEARRISDDRMRIARRLLDELGR